MSAETQIPCFVSLNVEREFTREAVCEWMALLDEHLPPGVRTTVRVDGRDGGSAYVPMLCKASKSMYRYMVPLTRHLIEDEARPIAEAASAAFPFDFDIVVSKCEIEAGLAKDNIKIEDERYKAICQAFAKRQHEQWVKDRLSTGWRYSTTLSVADKTSPMLRSWDDLPESLRQVDYKQPQAMVDLLNDQGYAVISKDELAAIYKLVRNTI